MAWLSGSVLALILSFSANSFADAAGFRCEQLFTGASRVYNPQTYAQTKAASWLKSLKARAIRSKPVDLPINLEFASSQHLLKWLYSQNLIEASDFSAHLADKLFAAKLLKTVLGHQYSDFHPEALGLKEFLLKHRIFSPEGQLIAGREQVLEALKTDFPNGFVVKPTTGMASAGKGFVVTENDFLNWIFNEQRDLSPANFSTPDRALELGQIALSGERWFIMGKIAAAPFLNANKTSAQRAEFRVHSFWNEVIPSGTINRFYLIYDQTKAEAAERLVQSLLDRLPPQLTQSQAWSFDVIVDENGKAQIVELNSNGGMERTWSGFFSMPEVNGAYSRYFERVLKWRFLSQESRVLLAGIGNLRSYFKGELERWLPQSLGEDKDRDLVRFELEEFYHLYVSPFRHGSTELLNTASGQLALKIGREIEGMLAIIDKNHSSSWDQFRDWAKGWIKE